MIHSQWLWLSWICFCFCCYVFICFLSIVGVTTIWYGLFRWILDNWLILIFHVQTLQIPVVIVATQRHNRIEWLQSYHQKMPFFEAVMTMSFKRLCRLRPVRSPTLCNPGYYLAYAVSWRVTSNQPKTEEDAEALKAFCPLQFVDYVLYFCLYFLHGNFVDLSFYW